MDKIRNAGPSRFQYRYLARFIIEAKSPLAVGSGNADLLTDAPVALDVNGMPYIPGTSIAGVVRHQLDEQQVNTAAEWGCNTQNANSGSNIIFTEARILDSLGHVADGMNLQAGKDALLQHYLALPIRQHVRINEKGTTADAGKFDGQVVYAGTRFCFEMEWLAAEKDDETWNRILAEFLAPSFRLGSGTRCGFGEMAIVGQPAVACLDLKDAVHLALYLSKPSELERSASWQGWTEGSLLTPDDTGLWQEYQLELVPQDLFLFAAAGGDENGDADTTAVRAQVVKWNEEGKGRLVNNQVLIPATSIKGAIAHRIAFHFNRLSQIYAEALCAQEDTEATTDLQEQIKQNVGGKNTAVVTLLGSEGEYRNKKQTGQIRGNVIFSDIILDDSKFADKLVNHVTIDDFTGAAIEGHLFTEQPVYGNGEKFMTSIFVRRKALLDETVGKALECTLSDICEGYLPLGGGTNRGNGLFVGSWIKK